ncbi:protein Loquacious-like [Watersipora subatra]|uniref:protein Loquacious-like n=1 Tax=Watersipora subatra TaxID=2589382 RepID=UPI00355C2CA9
MADLQKLLKGKTPVSLLQEICSKKKLTASYSILANEGPVHEPVFVMRAQAGEFQGTGKGSSKKKAKHNAASQLLCNMHGIEYENEEETPASAANPDPSESNEISNGHSHSQETPMSSGVYKGDGQNNPIGELQEYTQKNLLRPPLYEFISEQGPPHAREFVCTVKLVIFKKIYQETAVGKSKKVAKRAAASKLLQSVQHWPTDVKTVAVDEEEDELPLSMSSQQSELKGKNIPVLSAEGGKLANEFYEKLRLNNKLPGRPLAMQALHQTDLNSGVTDCAQLLADLAKGKKFDVRYLELSAKTYSGQYQCLVQLSTQPIAVCYGTGLTMTDARTCAAHNALQYLKVMTAED